MHTWCSHMDVRMKKSSMNTAPNGRMPPMRMENSGCMYHACAGTWRGILLVRTGCATASFLKPKYELHQHRSNPPAGQHGGSRASRLERQTHPQHTLLGGGKMEL